MANSEAVGRIVESSQLPGSFESDPIDCMIVSTARKLNATIVTKDRVIIEYGKKTVKVMAV